MFSETGTSCVYINSSMCITSANKKKLSHFNEQINSKPGPSCSVHFYWLNKVATHEFIQSSGRQKI